MDRPEDRRPVILLTGFGPFPGVAENASALLAKVLAEKAQRRFPKKRFVAATLPTEWDAGPLRLTALLKRHRPMLCLHFGVSDRAKGFVVETKAHNAQGRHKDATGRFPARSIVSSGGEAVLDVSIPAAAIAARLKRAGWPTVLSTDAGNYLCNCVLYASLETNAANGAQTGFIHIPAEFKTSDFDLETAVGGGIEIIRCCLGLPFAGVERIAGR